MKITIDIEPHIIKDAIDEELKEHRPTTMRLLHYLKVVMDESLIPVRRAAFSTGLKMNQVLAVMRELKQHECNEVE